MKKIITLLLLLICFANANSQTWTPKKQIVPYDLTRSSVYLKKLNKHIKFAFRGDYLEAWEYDYNTNYMYYIDSQILVQGQSKDVIKSCCIGDDKILVCLANKYFDFKKSMFVLDYSKKKFETISTSDDIYPPMLVDYSLTYIGNNQAMLFGGEDASHNWKNDVWIFDLNAKKWTKQVIDSLNAPQGRKKHAATFLEPDKVIIHGGCNIISYNSTIIYSDTWIYDLSNNKWDSVPAGKIRPAYTKSQTLINIDNKKAILFGSSTKSNDTLYSFNLNSKQWEAQYFKNILPSRFYNIAEFVTPNKILINSSDINLIYDIDSNKFANWDTLNNVTSAPYYSHALCSIGDSSIILHGGMINQRTNYNNSYGNFYFEPTWILDFKNYTWKLLAPEGDRPWCLKEHAISNIGDDKALLFGGINFLAYTKDTWIYDLSENTWTKLTSDNPPSVRSKHAMCSIGDDKVVLFGGYFTKRLNDTWIYDLSENSWSQITPANGIKPSTRYAHAMCYIGDSKVLLFGGYDGAVNSETWVFDLKDNSWTLKTPKGGVMPSPRYFHSLTYMGGDNAVLFGGKTASGLSNEAWNYDLSMNTWTLISSDSLPKARYAHAMAGINGKAILVSGILDSLEEDEATWIFEYTNPTGIIESKAVNEFSAFPTPTNDFVTFNFIAGEGNCTIELYNLNGIKVKSYDMGFICDGDNALTVSTSDIRPGVYLVKIITQNGQYTGKIQIER